MDFLHCRDWHDPACTKRFDVFVRQFIPRVGNQATRLVTKCNEQLQLLSATPVIPALELPYFIYGETDTVVSGAMEANHHTNRLPSNVAHPRRRQPVRYRNRRVHVAETSHEPDRTFEQVLCRSLFGDTQLRRVDQRTSRLYRIGGQVCPCLQQRRREAGLVG